MRQAQAKGTRSLQCFRNLKSEKITAREDTAESHETKKNIWHKVSKMWKFPTSDSIIKYIDKHRRKKCLNISILIKTIN